MSWFNKNRYSILSLLILACSFGFVFTSLNSRVLGSLGDLSKITPLIVLAVLNIMSVALAIKSSMSGGSKIFSLIATLLAVLSVAVLLLGGALAGFH